MNENANNVSTLTPAPTTAEQGPQTRSRRALLGWFGRVFPSVLVLAALGGIAYLGHHTGWTLPKFSVLAGEPQPAKEDWCGEHNVPESQCVECNPALLPRGQEFGWCPKHGIPDCPLEHPEVAQLKGTPQIAKEDLARAERALALAERPENNSKCKTHLRRIQFASAEAVDKAGIEVAPVWEAPIVEAIAANGEVTYDQTRVARLSTRAPGSIRWVGKKVGDPVKRGEVVALVDAAEVGRAKGEFLQAFVQLRLKSQTLEKMQELFTKGALPERTLREAEAAASETRIRLLSAQQSLTNLGFPIVMEELKGLSEEKLSAHLRFLGLPAAIVERLDSQRTTTNLMPVTAPLDGVVIDRAVVAGEVVDTTKPLLTVANTEQMWLTLSIRQEDTRRLMLGQPIHFRPEGGAEEVTGKISWVSTAVDEKTRTVKVRADVDNRAGLLRANSFGPGKVVLREENHAIVVPNEAVHWDGDCTVVFVRDKDFLSAGAPKVFHVRKVRVGAKDEKSTEIIAGVLRGEVVATKGSAVLRAELLKTNLGEG